MVDASLPRGPALRTPEMSQSLRRRAAELIGQEELPMLLWVANSPFADAMAGPQPGPTVEHGDAFDWLLALGDEVLGLIRVPPGRPMKGSLVAAPTYGELHVSVEDHGGLEPRRVFLLTLDDGRWIALGARLRGRRRHVVDAFTEELVARTRS